MWRKDRDKVRVLAALGLVIATVVPCTTAAQMGPLRHYGYLEYQQQLIQGDELPRLSRNAATWRTHATTWFWRPYILQVEGDLGLTRGLSETSDFEETGTSLSGGIYAQLFPRSRFPLLAFFEQRDSRTDGGPVDRDVISSSWGLRQSLSSERLGNYSLGYRRLNVEESYVDGLDVKGDSISDLLEVTGSKSLGRNRFDFTGSSQDLDRQVEMLKENRRVLNLRHQFNTGPRFIIDDTTFYSDERLFHDGRVRNRRLLQFNGRASWQPQTQRPLRVTGRTVLRATEVGSGGAESSMSSGSLSGTAVYRATDRLTLSGTIAFVESMPEHSENSTSVLQLARASYRGDMIDLGLVNYNWGGTLETGNRRQPGDGENSIQDYAASFDHGITKSSALGLGRRLDINFRQSASARADSLDRRQQNMTHTFSASLNQQRGRTSSYLQVLANDRRTTGFRESSFQIVSLQASSRMRVSRKRSLDGGLSLQYTTNSQTLMDGNRNVGSALSYSANLRYNEQDLFSVNDLDFVSELRLLSSEFQTEDIFDRGLDTTNERDTNYWKNLLTYRIAQLELRLEATVREFDDRRRSRIMFLVRRYYGSY